ncbi:MAG TPA: SRPBCC family protein [Candidatus Baltobacteraceae bacterium]
MKTFGVSRSTAASPQTLWRLWADANNWSAWNSGIRSAQVDGPISDGVRGVMTTNRGSVHDVTFHSVIAGQGFSLSMAGPPLTTITFSCDIVPDGQGSTIAQNVAFAGPLGFLFGAMMGAEMAKHFVSVLDDLARTAEAQS